MRIVITEQMKLDARKYSDLILAKPNIQSKPNYTGFMREDRFYHGYLGEFVFCKALEGKRFDYTVRTDGTSEAEDFVVYYKGKRITIDTKTASQPFHKLLTFPVSQGLKYHIYVGVKLENGFGIVKGYCKWNQLEVTDRFGTPSYQKPFESLTPIQNMLKKIDNE